MSNRPSACITSHDGLDTCVATNTDSLYRKLGFIPLLTRKFLPADVLVLLRGAGRLEIDCSAYQSVHVFNYVGQDRSGIVLLNVRHLVVIEHQDSLIPFRPRADRNPDIIIRGRHAVYPDLWRRKPQTISVRTCHIGNFKPIGTSIAPDACQQRLIKHMQTDETAVWGRGWDQLLPPSCLRGTVSLWSVPKVFSRCGFTLGLRYPYQRENDLISSRYWLAPLAGCPVVSDEPCLSDAVPGVVFDSLDRIRDRQFSRAERERLVNESSHHWAARTEIIESQLRGAVAHVRPLTTLGVLHHRVRAGFRINMLARRLKSALERI